MLVQYVCVKLLDFEGAKLGVKIESWEWNE